MHESLLAASVVGAEVARHHHDNPLLPLLKDVTDLLAETDALVKKVWQVSGVTSRSGRAKDDNLMRHNSFPGSRGASRFREEPKWDNLPPPEPNPACTLGETFHREEAVVDSALVQHFGELDSDLLRQGGRHAEL